MTVRALLGSGPTEYLIGEFGVGLVITTLIAAFICWRKRGELTLPLGGASLP